MIKEVENLQYITLGRFLALKNEILPKMKLFFFGGWGVPYLNCDLPVVARPISLDQDPTIAR